MSFSKSDQELQRYVDGQLSESEAATFVARMLSDNGLRQRVEALEQVQTGFAAAADSSSAASAPAGFTANVMSEVRRLPSREQLQQNDMAETAARLCRRLFIAAAMLLGLGLGWQSGLLSPNGSDQIEAATPAEVESEMQRLDDLIMQSMEAPRRGK
ncbi:MAG: anti-sigma factor RsiW [Planctomycetota bacterium]|jgi:anti-sigma factor RsiW